jgi:hypothetical protein
MGQNVTNLAQNWHLSGNSFITVQNDLP